ncbi:hypothetical protein VNI00_015443 [Paramarasmius palmivorus]|uniref:Uncharacterized protein n=1 Tax=Paramarasmius palmivorus TaxID=297713 RepID=A0AAW0BLE6_9AGAR
MSRIAQVDEDDTYLLIANLHLRDVEEANTGRKGKARDNAPLNDEELAFQLQAEILRDYLVELGDRRLALSIGDALDSDQDVLQSIRLAEQGVEDDHRYAAALSFGQPLPERSQAQLFLEGSREQLDKAKTLPPTHEEHLFFEDGDDADYYEASEVAGSSTQASGSTYPISKASM